MPKEPGEPNFESKEGEDLIDVLSSCIREIADTGKGIHEAQMLQNVKTLWERGERGAAINIVEAYMKGQDDALGSAYEILKSESSEVAKNVYREGGMRQKLHKISCIMERETNREFEGE